MIDSLLLAVITGFCVYITVKVFQIIEVLALIAEYLSVLIDKLGNKK